jgi:hypothetical protein
VIHVPFQGVLEITAVNLSKQLSFRQHGSRLGLLPMLVLFVLLISVTVFAPQRLLAQDSAESSAANPDAKSMGQFVESVAKTKLSTLVNDAIKRRLHPSQFYLEVTTQANAAKIDALIQGWGKDNLSLLRNEIKSYDYFELRDLLRTATIAVRYSSQIKEDEWAVMETELQSLLARAEGTQIEQFEASQVDVTPELSEKVMLLKAQKEREQLEQEYKLKNSLEETRSQLRQRELQREYDLKKGQNELEKSALENELQTERQKRFELADLLSKDFNVKEYLLKQYPVLANYAALGSGLGAFIVVALLILGLFIVMASGTLGRQLKSGVHEVALALKGENKNEHESDRAKQLKADREARKTDEERNADNAVEFDNKPELKDAADKLRAQVERDIQTTAVVMSKVVEEEKYGEVIAIFDILGADLARAVFRQMTSTARKRLQRAFYTGQIKRPSTSALFNRINELRAMLASTDVMMSEVQDKEFAQIVLAYPDEEIAKALTDVPLDESVSLLSRLPPERMLSIIRSLPQSKAGDARSSLGKIVRKGVEASLESIRVFTGSIMNEARLRFEENKKFLQGVIDVASESEAESIISGLRFDPKLLLEVIGVRASIDDLWAQSVETIESLFSGLELECIVALLQSAPEDKSTEVSASFPARKRALASDIKDNIIGDKDYAATLEVKIAPERKRILGRLSEMGKAGTVILPSYEKLKAQVARQEELEKEGNSYEDSLQESGIENGAELDQVPA